MAKTCSGFLLLLLLMAMGGGGVAVAPNITCGKVTSTLAPCLGYVMNGGTVPYNCCNGVKSLNGQASTTPARRYMCTCLKSITSTASPAMVKNAQTLPGKCGISLPFEISRTMDCNKLK